MKTHDEINEFIEEYGDKQIKFYGINDWFGQPTLSLNELIWFITNKSRNEKSATLSNIRDRYSPPRP